METTDATRKSPYDQLEGPVRTASMSTEDSLYSIAISLNRMANVWEKLQINNRVR